MIIVRYITKILANGLDLLTVVVKRVETIIVNGMRRRGLTTRKLKDNVGLDLKELAFTEDMT